MTSMKRRRSGTVYTCEYVGCNKVLGSKRQLDAHEKTHVAAHPFTCPECSQRFSLKSELESHQTIHQPATQEMELPADASQIVEMAECDEDDIDDELKKEAAELVENAVYLASQLKIARVSLLFSTTNCGKRIPRLLTECRACLEPQTRDLDRCRFR